jgi:hypothetical protein
LTEIYRLRYDTKEYGNQLSILKGMARSRGNAGAMLKLYLWKGEKESNTL